VKKFLKQLSLLLLPALLLVSCEKEIIPADEVELGKDYFPRTVGHYVEYQVDSIIYNDFTQTTDTFRMEFRDEISSEFTDNENRPSYVVDRYVRQDSTYAWTENMSYYITATSFRMESIENNMRFIKLVFPVKLNTKWYGNAFIPASFNNELKWFLGWEYKYVNVSEPYNNGKLAVENTVTVNQVDNTEGAPDSENEFSARTYAKEVYGKNIGLIYRELTRWEYQPTIAKYRKGFTLYMRAIRHN